MNKHPYLRAYLAGIAVPTVFLLVAMIGYTIVRYVYDVPIPVERVIVFPMAAVPNAWGLWNVLYRAFIADRHISLGVFGGALPLAAGTGRLRRHTAARFHRSSRSVRCGSLCVPRGPDCLLSRMEVFRGLPQRGAGDRLITLK